MISKIPDCIRVSPITLPCPLCFAESSKDCHSSSDDDLPLVHVARIKVAAKMNATAKKARG